MRTIWVVGYETFLRLRRDQIFVPFLLFSVGIFFLSYVLALMSIEDRGRMIIDLSRFALNIFGNSAAIYWSVQLVSGLEYRLLSPYPRWYCLLGTFLGLGACLSGLLIFFVLNWLLIVYLLGIGVFSLNFLGVFLLQMLGWFVISACTFFIATFASPFVALFVSFAAFISGLVSSLVASAIPLGSSPIVKILVESLAKVWDLQVLNPSFEVPLTFGYHAGVVAYAGSLVFLFLGLAAVTIRRRDFR